MKTIHAIASAAALASLALAGCHRASSGSTAAPAAQPSPSAPPAQAAVAPAAAPAAYTPPDAFLATCLVIQGGVSDATNPAGLRDDPSGPISVGQFAKDLTLNPNLSLSWDRDEGADAYIIHATVQDKLSGKGTKIDMELKQVSDTPSGSPACGPGQTAFNRILTDGQPTAAVTLTASTLIKSARQNEGSQ